MIWEHHIEISDRRDSSSPITPSRKERQKRILVIDDSADSLFLIKTILETDDYLAFTAKGGKAALKALGEGTKPDLIFLDIQMDDMNGFEFLNALESQFPGILEKVPVVFLTALKEVPVSKAAGHIRKPIMINSFLTETRRFIGEAATVIGRA